jgi:hypothetical protein
MFSRQQPWVDIHDNTDTSLAEARNISKFEHFSRLGANFVVRGAGNTSILGSRNRALGITYNRQSRTWDSAPNESAPDPDGASLLTVFRLSRSRRNSRDQTRRDDGSDFADCHSDCMAP